LTHRSRQQKVDGLLNDAGYYIGAGNLPSALSDLLIAYQLQPESDEANYQPGRFYYYYQYDLEKAKFYRDKCLRNNPDHRGKKEILFNLGRNVSGK
jgi:tetratricopeptide (TPR) repeat protein